MELSRPPLVVAFELSEKRKAIVADALAGASAVVYLTELDEAARTEALRNTGALLTFNTSKELRSGEAELLDGARLIQFMIAGVDFIPLGELPEGVPVATNGGGYAESMAEHALAMALAAANVIYTMANQITPRMIEAPYFACVASPEKRPSHRFTCEEPRRSDEQYCSVFKLKMGFDWRRNSPDFVGLHVGCVGIGPGASLRLRATTSNSPRRPILSHVQRRVVKDMILRVP
jgi:lactate dehydrogenase-like 2-hydroxyacid dehydrogenase